LVHRLLAEEMMMTKKSSAEKTVRDIRRATRKRYSSEEKIRIVLEGLRGEESVAELCRKEGITNANQGQRMLYTCQRLRLLSVRGCQIQQLLVMQGLRQYPVN